MTKIIVITDLHITSAGDTIIRLDPVVRFQSVLDAALTDHPDARMLILMGDLTHHGTVNQYERLHGALKDCPIPVIPMLGNHDRRDAFYAVFAEAPKDGAASHNILLTLIIIGSSLSIRWTARPILKATKQGGFVQTAWRGCKIGLMKLAASFRWCFHITRHLTLASSGWTRLNWRTAHECLICSAHIHARICFAATSTGQYLVACAACLGPCSKAPAIRGCLT